MFPSVASFTCKSVGFEAIFDLAQLTVQYSDVVDKVEVDYREI